ncbi:MAG: GNAT family N-acetyltransferase [Lacisediminihabitans sp.]
MDDAIATIRSFNRSVTGRVGALDVEYLDRGRPLGASRLLWELAEQGTDARELRARLCLDSGYLSRLLRTLEAEHLVEVSPDPADLRARVVRPTDAGMRERAELDRLSDGLAASILTPLSEANRARLLEAMAVVDRLLTASSVELAVEPPTSADAIHCIRAYFAELDERFDAGFDPALSIPADATELTEPSGMLLVARLRGRPIGCGAIKLHGSDPAEVKRMWVHADARGLGVGRRILLELERLARDRNVVALRLETNRDLGEAISLYRSSGYEEVPAFNDEPYAHHWFEKTLADAVQEEPFRRAEEAKR